MNQPHSILIAFAILFSLLQGCTKNVRKPELMDVGEGKGPIFPAKPLREGVEGFVELEFIVDTSGTTRDIRILHENPKGFGFGEAAIEAVSKLRFKPATLHGKVVNQKLKRRFNWKHPDSKSE